MVTSGLCHPLDQRHLAPGCRCFQRPLFSSRAKLQGRESLRKEDFPSASCEGSTAVLCFEFRTKDPDGEKSQREYEAEFAEAVAVPKITKTFTPLPVLPIGSRADGLHARDEGESAQH